MLRFYRELLTGKSRIESLRLAQDAVRQDFPMEPVHWAGFVLYGRTGPLRRFEPIDDLTVGTLNLSEFRTDGQLNLTAVARHIVDGPDLGEAWQPTALELLTMIQRELLDDKDRPFALHLLADLANRIGDNDQAIQWFGEIAGDASVDEQARLSAAYNRAKAFMEAERFNESLTAHTQLRESFELSKELAANVINNIGVCQLFLGDTAGAFESFSLILKQPDFPHEIRTLARVNRVGSYPQDHTDEALAEINAILAQPEALSDEQMSGLKRQREQIRRRLGRA
jgi:tetratricopeptide (TPR) repeat protein